MKTMWLNCGEKGDNKQDEIRKIMKEQVIWDILGYSMCLVLNMICYNERKNYLILVT